MKCIQCGSEWSVSDKLKSNIIKCPFCNADLKRSEPREIVDVLIEWGNKEGIDFFKNPMKINGLLADMFPDKGRERNALKVALEKGIGTKIVQLHYEDDEGIRLIQINQMKQILLEDAWLSEGAAEFVMSTLITASDVVGGKARKNSNTQTDVEIPETKIHSQMKDDISHPQKQLTRTVEHSGKKPEKPIQDQIAELMEKGQKYEAEEELDKAVSAYTKASMLGNVDASYRIAEIFAEDESRLSESIKWYTRAAEQGHDKAQNNLGYMYEHGEGIAKNLKKAIYWYEKSAMNGNRNAQHNLAFFYYKGAGVPVNYKKAFDWYTKAAEQGHPGAQNNLGIMYEYGYGVEKNIKEAIKWYSTASKNSSEDGKFNYERCMKCIGANG